MRACYPRCQREMLLAQIVCVRRGNANATNRVCVVVFNVVGRLAISIQQLRKLGGGMSSHARSKVDRYYENYGDANNPARNSRPNWRWRDERIQKNRPNMNLQRPKRSLNQRRPDLSGRFLAAPAWLKQNLAFSRRLGELC